MADERAEPEQRDDTDQPADWPAAGGTREPADDAAPASRTDAAPAEEASAADNRERTNQEHHDKPGRDRQPSEGQVADAVSAYFFNFFDKVEAGAVGAVGRTRDEKVRRRATGRLAESEIEAVTNRYARPDGFEEAVDWLRRDRVLVLEGQPGTGRRSGAISLLREVTGGELVVLSPLVTLRELAEREYQAGYGYLVVDRRPDGNQADIDFTWAKVRDQVREGRSYLVLTSSAVAVRAADQAVRHVVWKRPPVAEVLRSQLLGRDCRADALDEVVTRLVIELPDACPLPRLIDLAELVSGGTEPEEALLQLDEKAGREVQSWFAEDPDRRAILEVAALSFLEGADVRSFETHLGRLQRLMTKRMSLSAKEARIAWRDGTLFADRSSRADGAGLVDVREAPSHHGPSRVVVFKDAAYGRFVVEELWRSRSVAFWDAIREWLDGIVADDVNIRVAQGLARFACVSFDEVERSYLDPWSWGRAGWAGQVTSTYVLWSLCHLDGLAPAALHTAVRWANDTDADRRWTALVAFAGDLGVWYPTDAANRLWQLTTQTDDLEVAGCTALGCLFSTLVDATPDDASVVLNLLKRQLERFATGGTDRPAPAGKRARMSARDLARMRHVTMAASLAVVASGSVRTQRPALFEYLHTQPGRLPLAARVCASLLRYRPLRRQALVALRRGLHALRDISDDACREAGAFGAALSVAMPPPEREPLRTDLMGLDEQLRREKQESAAEVLLACLDALCTNPTETGGMT